MRSLLLLLVATAACSPYSSNRSALVPHAAPRMTSGQPLPAKGALTLGASSVTHLGDPQVGDDPNAGVVIPGTQLFGALKGAFGDFSIGALYESGLDAGAKKLKRTQPEVNNGNVQGFGVTMDYSIKTGDPRFRIGVGFDILYWRIPWVEFSACVNPNPDLCVIDRVEARGTDDVQQLTASLTPSYKVSPEVSVFANFTLRNHPTIQQKIIETDPGLFDAEVQNGPANFLVAAGAELEIAKQFLASVVVYYDLSQNPVAYKPGVGLMFTLPFGQRNDAPPPQPVAPPPTYYAPPPPMAPPGP